MKHFLTILLLSCLSLQSCYSQEQKTGGRQPRILLTKAREDSLRSKLPPPKGFVSDYASIFTSSEAAYLDSLIRAYEQKTTVQIGVAVLSSGFVSEEDFEDYTFVMMNTWGVGQKEKDNGVLIVFAPDLRRIRIQNGYGIEAYLTDAETKAIIDNTIVPRFKETNYFEGVREGILAIIRKLEKSGL